jgi:hypothetical protein
MERIVGIGIAAFVAWTILFNPPTLTLPPGTKEVAHHIATGIMRESNDVDETIKISDEKGIDLGHLFIRDGRMLEPTSPAEPNKFSTERTEYRYLIDLRSDIGVWSGAFLGSGETNRIQYGLRYSPTRLLYGTVAPDLIVGEEAAGLGISVFPATDRCGRFWLHTGLGAWYVIPYDKDDKPATCLGLSIGLRPF